MVYHVPEVRASPAEPRRSARPHGAASEAQGYQACSGLLHGPLTGDQELDGAFLNLLRASYLTLEYMMQGGVIIDRR